jgi:hypothetical protein
MSEILKYWWPPISAADVNSVGASEKTVNHRCLSKDEVFECLRQNGYTPVRTSRIKIRETRRMVDDHAVELYRGELILQINREVRRNTVMGVEDQVTIKFERPSNGDDPNFWGCSQVAVGRITVVAPED